MKSNHFDLTETTADTPCKLYCDAGKAQHALTYGCGWVFCDHTGRVQEIDGATLSIEQNTVEAEQQAIERGIEILAGKRHIEHLIVYSDCEPAVRKANSDIGELGAAFESIRIEHIPRSENQLADVIASNRVDVGQRPSEMRYGLTD